MAREVLRASEIGAFIYCQRAWWYSRQGEPSANFERQLAGMRFHEQHGRQVVQAGCLRTVGIALLLIALALIAASLTQMILS